jgi:hypothetical protein
MVPEHTATVHLLPCHRFSVRDLFKIRRGSPDTFLRATSGLNLNLSEVLQLGELWGLPSMVQVYNNLIEPTKDANAGKLTGNRNFYNNDYMVIEVSTTRKFSLTHCQVQRGPGYVSTLKMYSTRTRNTECVNLQNVRIGSLSRQSSV